MKATSLIAALADAIAENGQDTELLLTIFSTGDYPFIDLEPTGYRFTEDNETQIELRFKKPNPRDWNGPPVVDLIKATKNQVGGDWDDPAPRLTRRRQRSKGGYVNVPTGRAITPAEVLDLLYEVAKSDSFLMPQDGTEPYRGVIIDGRFDLEQAAQKINEHFGLPAEAEDLEK